MLPTSMNHFSISHLNRRLPLAVGTLITLLYFEAYFSNPFAPGNRLKNW